MGFKKQDFAPCRTSEVKQATPPTSSLAPVAADHLCTRGFSQVTFWKKNVIELKRQWEPLTSGATKKVMSFGNFSTCNKMSFNVFGKRLHRNKKKKPRHMHSSFNFMPLWTFKWILKSFSQRWVQGAIRSPSKHLLTSPPDGSICLLDNRKLHQCGRKFSPLKKKMYLIFLSIFYFCFVWFMLCLCIASIWPVKLHKEANWQNNSLSSLFFWPGVKSHPQFFLLDFFLFCTFFFISVTVWSLDWAETNHTQTQLNCDCIILES